MTDDRANPPGAGHYVLLGIVALMVLILGFVMWATTARITGAIIAPGTLQADRVRQSVQHPKGGVIAELLVTDGSPVGAGDLLMRLDTASQQAELAYAREQLFDLTARQDRLRAEYSGQQAVTFSPILLAQSRANPKLLPVLEGQRSLFAASQARLGAEKRQLLQRKVQTTAQITGLEAQIVSVAQQITLTAAAMKNQKSLLARKLVPAATVLEFEREMSRLQGSLGELRGQQAQAREQIAGIELEILQRGSLAREKAMAEARDLEQAIRRLRKDAQQLQAEIAQARIYAPIAGIVHGMTVQTPRAVLRPADPVLYLIGQGRAPVVISQVVPNHIDQIAVGQQVKIRLSALDQRLTPEVFGRVTRISADVITDQRTGAGFFQVEVMLMAGALDRLPEGAVLLPGMPVETFIHTGLRSPMAYFLKPMADYFARAFCES